MSDQIIEIVSRTCDPALNNEDRRNYFMILDNYQNELFQLNDLKTLLSPYLNHQVNIWGLKCLEHFILYKWNVADKNTAKTYLIEIIKEYNNFNIDPNSERVMRWIISKCVLYFVRHECPQNCSTIINDLINLQIHGEKSQALILSILYCLSEFLPTDTQMPDKRKKEVIGYLTENFTIIVHFCLEFVQNSSNTFLSLKSEAINTIQSYSSWIKFDYLSSKCDQIFSVLINYLTMSNCANLACYELFEAILDRKCRPEERYYTLSTLVTNRNNLHQLLSLMKKGLEINISPYSDEKFRYLQKLFDVLLVMGNTVLNNWSKMAKDLTSDDSFDLLMDLIQLATHHPVKILAIEVLSFWYNGFKTDNDDLRAMLVNKAGSLLNLLKFYSMKQNIRNPSNRDHEYLVYLVELQDEETFSNRIRFETSKTISTLTEYFNLDIIALSLNMVSSVLTSIQQTQVNGSCPDPTRSPDSEIMKQFDASRFFTRCVLHNIFRPYSKTLKEQVKNLRKTYSDVIISQAVEIITSIVSSKISTIHVVTIYLDLLCLLLPFVVDDDVINRVCLEKIFDWFNAVDAIDASADPEYGLWRQLNKNCGVSLLRIFRDYSFSIQPCLFESIFLYYKSICKQIFDHPIIIEAMTIYICHSSYYTLPQQEAVLSQFINPIKQVLMSDLCTTVFENGDSLIKYLHMDQLVPNIEITMDYPSKDHSRFRSDITMVMNSLHGICSRLLQNDTDNSSNVQPESTSSNPCPMREQLVPLLPSLLRIIRSLNMVWSSQLLHGDFFILKEISVFYKNALINNNTSEKIHPNNAQSLRHLYTNCCNNFISRLQECVWLILSKYCSNFADYLYNLKEWQNSITEYVFADLDSLPNFKLNPLIKSFVTPFVANCPMDQRDNVLPSTIIPFVNYMFGRLNEQWIHIKTVQVNDDVDFYQDFQEAKADGDDELCNEIIEEQVLRFVSKSFCDLFKITMTTTVASADDNNKGPKLRVMTHSMFESNLNSFPAMLVVLNNLSHSITWKDSVCCSRLSPLIYPIINEINLRGFLNIDIVLFIFQQLISALNIFADNFANLKVNLLNLAVSLFDDHISKDECSLDRFFNSLEKSSAQSIKLFQKKMNGKVNLKMRRDNLQTLLQPYISVPTNQLFSQEVYIKDLPPLMKPHWKTKSELKSAIDSEEPLCLEDLFKH